MAKARARLSRDWAVTRSGDVERAAFRHACFDDASCIIHVIAIHPIRRKNMRSVFRNTRFNYCAVIVAALFALVPLASTATAATKAKPSAAPKSGVPSTVTPTGTPITFSTVFDITKLTDVVQKCGTAEPTYCLRTGFSQLKDNGGDIVGPGTYAMSAYQAGTAVGFTGTVLFDNVTVKGCGTGSMILSFGPAPGQPTAPDRVDPTIQLIPAQWQIVSAIGGLQGTRGEGLLRPDTVKSTTIISTGTGQIRCAQK
jgi:hypothetical protein